MLAHVPGKTDRYIRISINRTISYGAGTHVTKVQCSTIAHVHVLSSCQSLAKSGIPCAVH